MRVIAIRDTAGGAGPARAAFDSAPDSPQLSLGKEYPVHALAVFQGAVLVQILDDRHTIRWLPAGLFETREGTLPRDWVLNWFPGDLQMALGPSFVAADAAACRRMAALDGDSVAAFWQRTRREALTQPGAMAAAAEAPGGRRSSWGLVGKLALLLASLLLCAALTEVALRIFCDQTLFLVRDERNLMYHYDEILGWFPIPNSQDRFLASRTISVINNRYGFRGPEPAQNQQPGIAFLGDSFVWGFDVEADERFADKLQAKHPEWNIYNLGVSGYGTDQEYLLLQRYFDVYKPRVVFLLFCTESDHDDNSSNMRYGGYFKPYCTVAGTKLQLQGIPVPRCERAFFAAHDRLARSYLARLIARAWFKLTGPRVLHNPDPTGPILADLQKYVKSRGAVLVMGLTQSNPRLEEFLRHLKLPYVDLSTPLRYPTHGSHWTPEGHTFVCRKIEEFLVQGNYLAPGERAEGHIP